MTPSFLLIGALVFAANDATQSPEEMERRLNKAGGGNPTDVRNIEFSRIAEIAEQGLAVPTD